ncbi:MAG TPA: lipid A deacylase LpxR family protein [Bacteroidia bacterium]|jgi:hypothetical protein
MIKKALVCIILIFKFLNPLAAGNDSLNVRHENYFRYTYDNDFFNATDRYYTQGVRLELVLNTLQRNPVSKALLRFEGKNNYHGIAFERDGFTPRSIRVDSVYRGERPYAGFSVLSFFLISLDKAGKQKLYSQLELGVIGPLSMGEEEQKYIHRKLKNIQPLGWEHQVRNDIVLNYTARYEKGLVSHPNVELIGLVEARAGTLYDDASTGFMMRLGIMHGYFDNPGLSKTPGTRKFQCYFFTRLIVKGVAYNATMQGGIFNRSSPHIISSAQITRIVGLAAAGIVISYKRLSLEYSKSYITPEFNGGLYHGWGRAGINVCF